MVVGWGRRKASCGRGLVREARKSVSPCKLHKRWCHNLLIGKNWFLKIYWGTYQNCGLVLLLRCLKWKLPLNNKNDHRIVFSKSSTFYRKPQRSLECLGSYPKHKGDKLCVGRNSETTTNLHFQGPISAAVVTVVLFKCPPSYLDAEVVKALNPGQVSVLRRQHNSFDTQRAQIAFTEN